MAEEKVRMCRWEAVQKKRRKTSSGPPGPAAEPRRPWGPPEQPQALCPLSLFPSSPARCLPVSQSAPGEILGVCGICERGCQGSSGRSSRPVSSLGLLGGPLPVPEQPCRWAGACRGVWALTRRSRWRAWTPLPFFFIYYFLKLIDFNWRIIPLFYCDGFCHTSV